MGSIKLYILPSLLLLWLIIVKNSAMNHKNSTDHDREKSQHRNIPLVMRAGLFSELVDCEQNDPTSCRTIFSLTDEVTTFVTVLYKVTETQEKGDQFSNQKMEEIFQQFQNNWLEKQMPALLDKITEIIKQLRAKYVDKINEKVEQKYANGVKWQRKNLISAEIRIRSLSQIMERHAFERQLDQFIEQLGQIGLKIPEKFPKDFKQKLNLCMKLMKANWDNWPPEVHKELVLKIKKVSRVEENRIILARLLALGRNLIRKLLKSENICLWNDLYQAYYNENVAKGIECHLDKVDVMNFVNHFDNFGEHWDRNMVEMQKSRLLTHAQRFWPVDENGNVLKPNDSMEAIENEMRDYDVGLIKNFEIAPSSPIMPLSDMEIATAIDIAIEYATLNPDWTLDVPGFMEQAQRRVDKYHAEDKIDKMEFLDDLLEKLRFGLMANALVEEFAQYEFRRDKSPFSYPCAMVTFIELLCMNASKVLKKVLLNDKVTKRLMLDEYYEYCENNRIDQPEN